MDLQELINEAWSLKQKGELVEALKLYSQAFDILISEASTYAQSQEGTFVDKEEDGKKIRAILPKHFDKAKKYLQNEKAVRIISNNMGTILAELGDIKGAKKMFEQAINLTPYNIDYQDPKIGLKELEK